MHTKPTMTRLAILQEADQLGESLFKWRERCERRHGVAVRIEDRRHVILAGCETRADQTRRHDAIIGECTRNLQRLAS